MRANEAEDAGVPQNADVGRIDVLIRREVDAVAVPPPVGEIGEAADRQQVGRCKKREAILARQSLAAFDLVADRSEVQRYLPDRQRHIVPTEAERVGRAPRQTGGGRRVRRGVEVAGRIGVGTG